VSFEVIITSCEHNDYNINVSLDHVDSEFASICEQHVYTSVHF